MSLFDEPPPAPEPAAPPPVRERPILHLGKTEYLKPVCGVSGPATVLPALVTCPACKSHTKAAVRPSRPVYRRDGLCQACSSVATDGEFCAHHAQVWARGKGDADAKAGK